MAPPGPAAFLKFIQAVVLFHRPQPLHYAALPQIRCPGLPPCTPTAREHTLCIYCTCPSSRVTTILSFAAGDMCRTPSLYKSVHITTLVAIIHRYWMSDVRGGCAVALLEFTPLLRGPPPSLLYNLPPAIWAKHLFAFATSFV